MKKKNVLYLCGISMIFGLVCTGCGAASSSTGSVRLQGETPAKAVLLEAGITAAAPAASELTGQETFTEKEIAVSAAVYSNPDAASPILGALSEGTPVYVSGPVNEGVWYIVAYNGRAAYVPVEAVRELSNQNPEAAYVNPTPYYLPVPTVPETEAATEEVYTIAPWENPPTETPTATEPTEPVTEEPITEEPVTEESTTEEPVTEEPITEEPVTEEPTESEGSGEEGNENSGEDGLS
ncbi:MAG: hypothetical protein IKF90_02780 [Parasporobacterium sp.]|nr:hypothetical protein [Parasporobacterium sp.]